MQGDHFPDRAPVDTTAAEAAGEVCNGRVHARAVGEKHEGCHRCRRRRRRAAILMNATSCGSGSRGLGDPEREKQGERVELRGEEPAAAVLGRYGGSRAAAGHVRVLDGRGHHHGPLMLRLLR